MISRLGYLTKENGDLGEGVGDERDGVVGVVHQIAGQLVEDRDDLVQDGLADEQQLVQDAHELLEESTADGKNGVPDLVKTQSDEQSVDHVINQTLELISVLTLATSKKDHLDLSEGLLNVDRSLGDVVGDVVHQLGEDRGDLVPDGSAGEEQLVHDQHELIIESTTDGEDSFPQTDKRESQNLLEASKQHVDQPAEESLSWGFLGSESAGKETQSHKNGEHFKCFLFLF